MSFALADSDTVSFAGFVSEAGAAVPLPPHPATDKDNINDVMIIAIIFFTFFSSCHSPGSQSGRDPFLIDFTPVAAEYEMFFDQNTVPGERNCYNI